MAWVLRVTVDAAALFVMAGRLTSVRLPAKPLLAVGVAAVALLAAAFELRELPARAGLLAVALGLVAVLAWRMLVTSLRSLRSPVEEPTSSGN